MKTYNKPIMKLAFFKLENITTESAPTPAGDYSANMLNEVFFNAKGVSSTTTVHVQKISGVLEFK